jgi:hypothetical protein
MKNYYQLFLTVILVFSFESIQAQCSTDANYLGGDNRALSVTSAQNVSQSFRAISSGGLNSVSLDMSATNPGCTLTEIEADLKIYEGDGIAGAILASQTFTLSLEFLQTYEEFVFAAPATLIANQMYTIDISLIAGQDCGSGSEPDLIWHFSFPTNYYNNTGGAQYVGGNVASLGNTQKFTTCVTCLAPVNTVTTSGNYLIADEAGATYQWLDCDNQNTPINGAIGQAFSPDESGNYAVEITSSEGCPSTSDCQSFSTLSINVNNQKSFSLYPNPVEEILTLELNQSSNDGYMITDQLGKVVKESNTPFQKQVVDVSDLSRGIYVISVGEVNQKFVKK